MLFINLNKDSHIRQILVITFINFLSSSCSVEFIVPESCNPHRNM